MLVLSELHKPKRHDLIDMFNDTSRYLDDIFTIDDPEFEKYIHDMYQAELQLNKANLSDKETSSVDLNIKVIGSYIHTSVYDKRDDFGFDIYNFQLVRFDRCCTSVLDFHSKNLQITSKLLTQGYWYQKLRNKHLASSLDHTPNFCRNLVIFRSKNICVKESLTRSFTVI